MINELPHTDPPQVEAHLWRDFSGDLALDVGAHDGESVRFMEARGFRRIILFEPDPRCAESISLHAAKHMLVPCAVGSSTGTLSLCYGSDMLRSPDIEGLDWTPGGSAVEVPCTTLDTYCLDRFLHPDLIKVDVEGGEVEVVSGASYLVDLHRTDWLIEFHSAENLTALQGIFTGYDQEVVRHPNYPVHSDLWHRHGWLRIRA